MSVRWNICHKCLLYEMPFVRVPVMFELKVTKHIFGACITAFRKSYLMEHIYLVSLNCLCSSERGVLTPSTPVTRRSATHILHSLRPPDTPANVRHMLHGRKITAPTIAH